MFDLRRGSRSISARARPFLHKIGQRTPGARLFTCPQRIRQVFGRTLMTDGDHDHGIKFSRQIQCRFRRGMIETLHRMDDQASMREFEGEVLPCGSRVESVQPRGFAVMVERGFGRQQNQRAGMNAPASVRFAEKAEKQRPVVAGPMCIEKPPGLIVESRRSPAGSFECGEKIRLSDRLAGHGSRRPAARDDFEDRMFDLTLGHGVSLPHAVSTPGGRERNAAAQSVIVSTRILKKS